MFINGEYRQEGDKMVMAVPCERCGAIIGDLAIDEVCALLSGKYGKVLCFDCEESSCSNCQKELVQQDDNSVLDNGVCWFCAQEGNTGRGTHYPGAFVNFRLVEGI